MSSFSDLRASNKLSYKWFMITIFFGVASLYLILERGAHAPDTVIFALNQAFIGLTFGSGVVTAICKFTQSKRID